MSREYFFSDVVKEAIGNERVTDQFDIEYEASFYGTMQDSYITGSMLSIEKSPSGVAGLVAASRSRGSQFSVYTAESAAALSSDPTSTDVTLYPLKSMRLEPYFNKCSSTAYRITQCLDSSERYYDTCMPDMSVCFSIDGASVWLIDNSSSPTQDTFGLVGENMPYDTGYIMFNVPSVPNSGNGGWVTDPTSADNDWTWSYPFEPKYSAAPRLIDSKNFGIDGSTRQKMPGRSGLGFSLTDVNKSPVAPGLLAIYPGYVEVLDDSGAGYDVGGRYVHMLFGGDYDLKNSKMRPLTIDDTSRFLFGFGDFNGVSITGSPLDGDRIGANNYPVFRYRQTDGDVAANSAFTVSPIIRGWRYGVHSGLPVYSKSLFRRNKFGQYRDMLEQRQDSKFVYVTSSPVDQEAIVVNDFSKAAQGKSANNIDLKAEPADSPVQVAFVRRTYSVDKVGIGTIANNPVSPAQTFSQNLSTEAASSVPYFDGVARLRQESEYEALQANYQANNPQVSVIAIP